MKRPIKTKTALSSGRSGKRSLLSRMLVPVLIIHEIGGEYQYSDSEFWGSVGEER